MLLFLLGLVLFFGLHLFSAVRTRDAGRDLKVRLGYGPFMGLYSLISLMGFVLICYGYGQTRGMGVLYTPPLWTQHLNLLIMLPAMILLVASQMPTGYIRQVSRHPMLLAVKLWAVGHLLANGEYNSVILFGTFLAFAVFDRIMVKRRGDMGPGPDVVIKPQMDAFAILLGLGLYAFFALYLHPLLIGVAVIS